MARGPALVIPLLLLVTVPLAGCLQESDWALDMTGIAELHRRGLSGAGVRVAVIDTGIDPSHPEFEGLRFLWQDFVNSRPQPYDDSQVGHGTHVAGIIVAQGNLLHGLLSGVRLKGAAPGVSLIVAKAVAGTGEGRDEDVAEAVDFAIAQGAHVIVMSLGGRPGRLLVGTQTENAVNRALDRGIVVVAAAGNKQNDGDSNDDVASPASVTGVIAVGAVNQDGRVAPFSFKGDDGCTVGPVGCRTDPNRKPELVAPGVGILSAAKDGRYAIADGTSQATPFVAAGVALLLEAHPEYKAGGAKGGSRQAINTLKSALAQSAEKVGPLTGKTGFAHDSFYGYGIARLDRAVARL